MHFLMLLEPQGKQRLLLFEENSDCLDILLGPVELQRLQHGLTLLHDQLIVLLLYLLKPLEFGVQISDLVQEGKIMALQSPSEPQRMRQQSISIGLDHEG